MNTLSKDRVKIKRFQLYSHKSGTLFLHGVLFGFNARRTRSDFCRRRMAISRARSDKFATSGNFKMFMFISY